jgi:mannose-6-phosphate isomerase
MSEPIAFLPLLMDRVWGGRKLEEAFDKALPPEVPIGESWEVVDRPDEQSVVRSGPWAGRTLHELWSQERERLFGRRGLAAGERFPILVKLLDAREPLSVQVHPPQAKAAALGGEAKSELWYLAAADPGAHLFAGLRDGVTRERFGAALEAGEDVSGLLQRLEVVRGDAIFIPSGRVHAIGGGCIVVEVQQNSDTTFRVFDFNRLGLDGKPRKLHVAESMAAIDWDDVAPSLDRPSDDGTLAANEHFTVRRCRLEDAKGLTAPGECAIVCVVEGEARCDGTPFAQGETFLLPADDPPPVSGPADVLVIELPDAAPA